MLAERPVERLHRRDMTTLAHALPWLAAHARERVREEDDDAETARFASNGHERITSTKGYANTGRAMQIQRPKGDRPRPSRSVRLVDWAESLDSSPSLT